MATYKPLTFFDLCKTFISKSEKTGDEEYLENIIEDNYKDILEYIALTGKSGELAIKLKIKKQDDKASVLITANVSKKLEKIKNYLELDQDDNGQLFLDNADQQVLPGVLPVGTSNNSEDSESSEEK